MTRPSTAQRGYGASHQRARARVQPIVDAGNAICCRCMQPILPGQEWDLDHTDDRRGYRGPSHARAADCPAGGNRATKSHQPPRRRPPEQHPGDTGGRHPPPPGHG